jgi:hypothetical protein
MKAVLIIAVVAAVVFIIPIILFTLSYVFGTDIHEDGSLRECIGCPVTDKEVCKKECSYYKSAEKISERMQEDREQEIYLQEYAKRKREKKKGKRWHN